MSSPLCQTSQTTPSIRLIGSCHSIFSNFCTQHHVRKHSTTQDTMPLYFTKTNRKVNASVNNNYYNHSLSYISQKFNMLFTPLVPKVLHYCYEYTTHTYTHTYMYSQALVNLVKQTGREKVS